MFSCFRKSQLVFSLIFLCFKSYSLVFLIPDQIDVPDKIEKKTAGQIKAILSSLEKKHKNKTANIWSLRYRKALLLEEKDTEAFCGIMKELSQVPAFPLKSLALVKSYSLCPFESDIEFDISSVPDWLRLELAKAFYKRRKFFDNPKQTLKAVLYLGENSPYKELRVSFLKQALALVQESDHGASEKARIQKLLYKESPSLHPQPKKEDYFSTAEDFRENRKFKKAIRYYVEVLNLPQFSFDEKNLSFKGLDRIYKIQGNRKKKIVNSKQWLVWLLRENSPQSLRIYYSKKLGLARQKWNADENKEAIRIITDLLKEEGSKVIENEALFLRGSIYFQENQKDLSLKDWNQVIKNLSNRKYKRDLLVKAVWRKAWLYRESKDYKKALENFKILKKIAKNPYTYHRAVFWIGKTYEDLKYNFTACRTFDKLAEEDQYGYYGLLAHNKLRKKSSARQQRDLSTVIDKKTNDLIYWLMYFQEDELLSFFIESQYDKISNQKSAGLEEWLKIMWLWSQSGEHLEVFQSFQTIEPELKKIFLTKHSSFLFPLSFHEEIKKAGNKSNLSIPLIFSIIRQESAFNPRARSSADAFGLMQVIPSTAKQVSRENKIYYNSYRDLYNPSKNILIGTTYLKKLLKKYNNNFILALSAYNAGGTPVDRWKKELEHWSLLEFIENIPYEETRTYIRLIVRNYIFYHNLLKKDETDWLLGDLIQQRPLKKGFFKCF